LNNLEDAAVAILGRMSEAERVEKVKVIDSDLEGSCGLINKPTLNSFAKRTRGNR
jgi:hypothetical protein